MAKEKYLHGFSSQEQRRLMHQAEFLEPFVYDGIDLEFTNLLLEVGSGVGAQTKILARRFPKLKIHGVDLSGAQIKTAREFLRPEITSGQVKIFQQNADDLDMKDAKKYDAAFLCWFLEHVPDPSRVLKKIRTQLKKGAKIYCTEVFNQTLFVEPYSPAFLKYWFEFNDYQSEIKGHPFVGAQLGNLLKDAGYAEIKVEMRPFHFDSRTPQKRAAFTEFFFQILLSAEKILVQEKRVSLQLIQQMKKEFEIVKKSKHAVFFYAYVRATAEVPS